MKKHTLVVLGITLLQPAFAYEKIMQCKAVGTLKKKVAFEIEASVYDARVETQGTSIISWTDGKENRTQLVVKSKDHFQDDFSMHLTVMKKGEMIEVASQNGLSLKSAVEIYGIYKDFRDTKYKLAFECKKIKPTHEL